MKIKPRATPGAETEREKKIVPIQIVRLDADSRKAFIGLTGAKLDEENTLGCPSMQCSSLASLTRSSAGDRAQ
jgi:hypothetical protein